MPESNGGRSRRKEAPFELPSRKHGAQSFTCLDLFCGCGGFTLGMERAGFRCLAAIDFNAEAITTVKANFRKDIVALCTDLTRFTPDKLAAMLGPEHGRPFALRVETGKTVPCILQTARETGADLLVMGVRPAVPALSRFMWPNAYEIVRESSCPVLTVRGVSQ